MGAGALQPSMRCYSRTEPPGEVPQDEDALRVFDRRTLLKLSRSPLVHRPVDMAPFDQWYGCVVT